MSNNVIISLLAASLIICSCGNNQGKKAKEEASKAESQFRTEVVANIHQRADVANALIKEYNSNRLPEMPEMSEFEDIVIDGLSSLDDTSFNTMSERLKSQIEETIKHLQ